MAPHIHLAVGPGCQLGLLLNLQAGLASSDGGLGRGSVKATRSLQV